MPKINSGSDDFLKDANVEGDFDTLNNEPVMQQPGASVKIKGNPKDLDTPIPEAVHERQTINLDEDISENIGNDGEEYNGKQNFTQGSNPEENFNQEFHDLPEDEKDESASMTADAIIHAYSHGKLLIPKAIAISDRKLDKLHNAGEINKYDPVLLRKDSVETITVAQLVTNFNRTVTSPFETSEEFKTNVKPLLVHVLKKKGIAATPEQMLIYFVSVDMANTAINAYSARKERVELLDLLREHKASKMPPKTTGAVTPDVPPVNNVQQPYQNTNTQQETPQATPVEIIDLVIKKDNRGRKKKSDTIII